jgi:hypothetical protein
MEVKECLNGFKKALGSFLGFCFESAVSRAAFSPPVFPPAVLCLAIRKPLVTDKTPLQLFFLSQRFTLPLSFPLFAPDVLSQNAAHPNKL